MKLNMSSKKIYVIVRVGLGLVFIVSGAIKAMDLVSFSKVIEAFAILPVDFSYPAAVLISVTELLLGMGLVADIKGSLGGIFSLLCGFGFVLSWAIYMGYDIDCGCFGEQDPEAKAFASLRTSLFRDVFMIVVVSYLYTWRFKNNYIPGFPIKLTKTGDT